MVRDIKRYGNPACRERAIVQGPNCRFTVLTSSLIRMEYSENGSFEDRATQIVMNREFTVPKYEAAWNGGFLTITTEFCSCVTGAGRFLKTD